MQQFGSYKFSFLQKCVLFLVRCGISRGNRVSIISYLWDKVSGSGGLFDMTYESVRLRLADRGNTIERKILLSSKTREECEIEAIASALSQGGVFVDIGANIGYYSLMVANKCPQAKVIAYEPNPKMFDRLKTNIKLNNFEKQIRLVESGVGEKHGSASLFLNEGDSGSSSIVAKSDKKINIDIVPLKDSLAGLGVEKIHALKIDVEGFEDKALFPYFRSTDKAHQPDVIVIEDDKPEIWDENIIDYLLANGYAKHAKTRGNLILKRV